MDFFNIDFYVSLMFRFNEQATYYIIDGIIFAALFVLQAVGLYTIAKREGYKNRWLACIPFLNTYYVGVCAQKNKSFNTIDTRIVGAVTAFLDALIVAGQIILLVAINKLDTAGCIFEETQEGMLLPVYTLCNVPRDLAWAGWCFEYLEYLLIAGMLLLFIGQIMLYTAFFRTYISRRYVLFTTFAILFPVIGALIFAVRNNRAMNYREFLYGEHERRYRAYQQYNRQNYQNPYDNNPYGQNNRPHNDPYGGEFNNNASSDNGSSNNDNSSNTPDDPFSDF